MESFMIDEPVSEISQILAIGGKAYLRITGLLMIRCIANDRNQKTLVNVHPAGNWMNCILCQRKYTGAAKNCVSFSGSQETCDEVFAIFPH